MSLRAHLWAMDDAPVDNPYATLLLIALADEADDQGRAACPYMSKLKQRARCSERSVQNWLRELYRARLIDFGDPVVARRRYNKAAGHAPRVWDLNLSANKEKVPAPRTDEEMRAYSDQIGRKPPRRSAEGEDEPGGVQEVHPTDTIPASPGDTGNGQLNAGVQEMHPSVDQEVFTEADHLLGCTLLHPSFLFPKNTFPPLPHRRTTATSVTTRPPKRGGRISPRRRTWIWPGWSGGSPATHLGAGP